MFDLPASEITPEGVVQTSRVWLQELIKGEARFPGDFGPARDRIARKHKLSKTKIWTLLYRKPKDICASFFLKLHAAYRIECERQMRKLAHDLEVTKAVSPNARSVAKADAFLDKDGKDIIERVMAR